MGITGFPHFEVHGPSKKTADGSSTKAELKKKLFGQGGRACRAPATSEPYPSAYSSCSESVGRNPLRGKIPSFSSSWH
jgi:hypothetical protein